MDTLPVAEHSWVMKSKHGESTSERLIDATLPFPAPDLCLPESMTRQRPPHS
jgi:hypothetical protein